MEHSIYTLADTEVHYHQGLFSSLEKLTDKNNTILITDEHVFQLHSDKFTSWKHIVIPPGEIHKNLVTIQKIIDQLILHEADRSTMIIGVGGGVVTDITGFVASIYMRGLDFAFVPTTILNLVDASLGGKTGIDYGVYKNMIGIIHQPKFIFQDTSFLKTLPQIEWENGFAEIIKHAAINDPKMFAELGQHNIHFYQNNKEAVDALISRNIDIKLRIVEKDVWEKGDRKLLNFGHTIGHAIENIYNIKHGHAISIGMVLAGKISQEITGFENSNELINLLETYHLPTKKEIQVEDVFQILKMDKKRQGEAINFILLNKIGHASIYPISLNTLYQILLNLSKNS